MEEIKIIFKRNLFIFAIVFSLFIFIGASCSFANDVNNFDTNVTAENNDNIVVGDFNELNNDIRTLSPGDNYNITKNYEYTSASRCANIDISANNVTINGNGHVLDGKGMSTFFKVTGNNVKILNLTFINGKVYSMSDYMRDSIISDKINYKPTSSYSPIDWLGNNGVISNCKFYNNSAMTGGAIRWAGNNGIINTCHFNGNVASGVGGAVLIQGTNCTISNSIFERSVSQLTGEAIYLDRKHGNLKFINNTVKDGKTFINGAKTNIDIDLFRSCSYIDIIWNKGFELRNILYSSIINGPGKLNNGVSYSAVINEKTDEFILSFNKCSNDGITLTKNYHFTDIHDYNSVFINLKKGLFKNNFVFTVTKTINTIRDYDAARKTSLCEYLNPYYEIIEYELLNAKGYNKDSVKTILQVNFAKEMSFRSTGMWIPSMLGFNLVYIDGNGSSILGSNERSDEEHWIKLDKINEVCTIVSNLHLKGFNSPVQNMGGIVIFNKVVFAHNQMDYMVKKDWGGAILNYGYCACIDCIFVDNYAKNGGAIFNLGQLDIVNCTFINNNAYGRGNDICVGKEGKIKVDGENITSNNEIVFFADTIGAGTITGIAILDLLIGSTMGAYLAHFIATTIGAIIGGPIGAVALNIIVFSCIAAGIAGAVYISYHILTTGTKLDYYSI